jgi:FkbM family methyltransferase
MQRACATWALLILAAISGAISFSYPELKALTIFLARRNNGCPLTHCFKTRSERRMHNQARQRIEAASRLLHSDPAGLELWDTPVGWLWVPGRKHTRYWLADMLAEADSGLYAHGKIQVRPGDVVLDCGASIGVFTRQALSMGAATVVAIEPGPDSVECLRRNFPSEIASGKLIVCVKGVWDREDALPLIVDGSTSIGDGFVIRRPGDHLGVSVPLTRIDTLVSELKLPRVDFIKMDIEGAEQEALRGARQTLARFRPRLVISAYHKREDPREIPALVRSARPDYRMECGACLMERYRIIPHVLFFE